MDGPVIGRATALARLSAKADVADAPRYIYAMMLFSSSRERNLWACAAAVMAAIYSTLGLARSLADALAGTGVGEGLFVVGCFGVLGVLVTRGLTERPGGAEMIVALGIATAYLLVLARMAVPTERSHLIEYGIVAVLIQEALAERAAQGRRVPVPAVLAVVSTALLGTLDECIQLLVPGRFFDRVDILFNVLAAVMAVAASEALGWTRRRFRRSP